MRQLALFCLLSFFGPFLWAASVPVLKIAGTINPGSADYVVSEIAKAEHSKAPFLILELDTPGGLLNSTRQMIQKMLNTSMPIVVFVSPRGAQAGSAGALITFGADVAAMAPGTNIGAAHPVSGGGEKADETLSKKVTNDTAAFAESLAKLHRRNTDWARKSVIQSASITADEALKQGVIDLIATNEEDLVGQLSNYPLKNSKNKIAALPPGPFTLDYREPSLKDRAVSFFSDPTLSYLILVLGGICIWIELSHPGLVLPGVVGVVSLLLSLISFQMLPIRQGALGLILAGLAMLILEVFLPTYGALGIGGLSCFVLGSLYLMDTPSPEFQIGLQLILPTAAVLALVIGCVAWIVARSQNKKVQTGMEALIGTLAEAREEISDKEGRVFVHGELWSARSSSEALIPKGSIVEIKSARDMILFVERKEKSHV